MEKRLPVALRAVHASKVRRRDAATRRTQRTRLDATAKNNGLASKWLGVFTSLRVAEFIDNLG